MEAADQKEPREWSPAPASATASRYGGRAARKEWFRALGSVTESPATNPRARVARSRAAALELRSARRRGKSAHQADAVTPLEVLYKPRPAYTPEARQLHLQGTVLLSAVFEASGQVRVLRVVRGLGHGLDQSAMEAARQIRFKPEQRNGHPVNLTATLAIVFQLAY